MSDFPSIQPDRIDRENTGHLEQTPSGPPREQNRFGYILSWRFKTQAYTHLLKRGLYGPAGREPTDRCCGKLTTNYYLLWRGQLAGFDAGPATPAAPPSALQR